MSAAQDAPSTPDAPSPLDAASLQDRLEALECHFTWNLNFSRSKLLRDDDHLEDIGGEEGDVWTGHVYNLRGFTNHQLGLHQDARRLLDRAAEAFRRLRRSGRGPWLLVHYADLAWLHHSRGDDRESRACLEEADALTKEYAASGDDGLHPEVLAEKAWTLMKFGKEGKLRAADLFQRALSLDPDRAEWRTSRALALANVNKFDDEEPDPRVLLELRLAAEQDPENLYLAAVHLRERAKSGEEVEDEVRELARRIFQNPVGSYRGLKPILRLYRNRLPIDEAVELTEEALRRHPDQRFLKRCAALCYKWKLVFERDGRPERGALDRAVSLHRDVIALYPRSSLKKEIDLARVLAKSSARDLETAEQMFQDILKKDLEPADQQMVYNDYAKFLNFDLKDRHGSVRYHMKAAAIPHASFYRSNSIKVLEKIQGRGRNRMCRDIQRFLDTLQVQEDHDRVGV